jgi:hypothetical protein
VNSWAVPIIGAIAALVAYLQWVTAHQRVVVDLFDKRLAAFNAIRDSVVPVMREAAISQREFFDFVRAEDRCRFLFGADVLKFLVEMRNDLAWLASYSDAVIDSRPTDQRSKLIDKKSDILIRVSEFDKTAIPLFARYMKLDQRMRYFSPLG